MTKTLLELRTNWADGSDFLSAFDADRRRLRLPIDGDDTTATNATEGELVAMTLCFDARGAAFRLHGRVIERVDQAMIISFLEEEHDRLELVLTCAEGESLPYFTRRFERTPATLPARMLTLSSGEELLRTETRAISEGGASVAANAEQLVTLHAGQRLLIELRFDAESSELRINCRVVSLIAAGPRPGFGVEFLFTSAEQRATLAAAVATLRDKR